MTVPAKKTKKYGSFLKDPEKVAEFLDHVRNGDRNFEAAQKVGVSRQLIEKYITIGRSYLNPNFKGKKSEKIAEFYVLYKEANPEAVVRPKHFRLDEYLITSICNFVAEGDTVRTAATKCGLAIATVNGWLRRGRYADPEDKAIYAEFASRVDAALSYQEQKLLDRMTELTEARSEKIQYEATAWMLERVHGYRRSQENVNVNTNVEYSITTPMKETGFELQEFKMPELEPGKDAPESGN